MAASNAAAFAALDRMIAKARAIPGLVKEAAPEIAKVVEAELVANVAAGVAPNGKAWALTKAGDKPLANAASHIRVRAVGTVIVVTLEGAPEVKHHLGKAKGRIRRQIIPTRKIPDTMTNAMREVFGRHFREAGIA